MKFFSKSLPIYYNNLKARNQNLQFTVANLFAMISSFLLIPIILNAYGITYLGIFSLILSINLIAPLLDFGYANTISTKLSLSKTSSNILYHRKQLRAFSLFFPGIFFIITAIVAIQNINSVYTLLEGNLEIREIKLLVFSLTVHSFMLVVFNIAHKFRLALNCYKMSSFVLATNSLIVLLCSSISIWMGSTFIFFVLVYLASSWIINIFYLKKTLKLIMQYFASNRAPYSNDPKYSAHYAQESLTFFVAQVSSIVAFQLDNFIVARYFSLDDVAIYSTAVKIVAVPIALIASYSLPIWTETARGTFGAKNKDIFVNLSKLLQRRLLLITPFALLVFLILPLLVDIWSSGKLDVSTEFVSFLVIWLVIAVLTQPIALVMNGMLFKTFILFSAVSGAIINISLSILLCMNYNLLAGPIIGSIFSQLISCLLPYYFVQRKYLNND